jgi:predicted RNA-binding Zn-ribbon protein involved in translation (DUF1610 family)
MAEPEESDSEHVDFPCPHCGETRVDYLEWDDDDVVNCLTCGKSYKPHDSI